MKEQNKVKNKITKIGMLILLLLGILLFKNNISLAESSAYYIGSKTANKATGYQPAKADEDSNLEVTLDLRQTLDKMLYYILTYEEYEDKTYIGDIESVKLEEKKQAAMYYLIHNYKQEENTFSGLTDNEKLKEILSNYAGSGNNLNELENTERNGAQIIYSLAASWAKGEDVIKTAKKLKVNYMALSNDNIRYWASITDEPLEGTIYAPEVKEKTLMLSIYIPQETEKTSQNAMKIVDQAIVDEKIAMIKSIIDKSALLGKNTEEESNDLADSLSDGETIAGTYNSYSVNIGGTEVSADPANDPIPSGYYCINRPLKLGMDYEEGPSTYFRDDPVKRNKYTAIYLTSPTRGTKNHTVADVDDSGLQNKVWKYLSTSGELNATGRNNTIPGETAAKESEWEVVGYTIYNPVDRVRVAAYDEIVSCHEYEYEYGGNFERYTSEPASYYEYFGGYYWVRVGWGNGRWALRTSRTIHHPEVRGFQFYDGTWAAGLGSVQPLIFFHLEKTGFKPKIKVKKYDNGNDQLIHLTTEDASKATFEIAGSTYTATSSETEWVELGVIRFYNNDSATVKVKETFSPYGFKLDNPNEVTVTYTTKQGVEAIDSVSCTGSNYEASSSGTNMEVEVKDTQIFYDIKIKKVNKQNTSQVIPGVTFEVSDGLARSESQITGTDGIATFDLSRVSFTGNSFTLKVKETDVPEHVKNDFEEATIEINVNQDIDAIPTLSVGTQSGDECEVTIEGDHTISIVIKDTVYVEPKLKIIKVDSGTGAVLAEATFHVEIPDVDSDFTTDSSGETSVMTFQEIIYADNDVNAIEGTIQEMVAPKGYRVDNKEPVTLKIWYSTTGSGTFAENRVYVEFVGSHIGYKIGNLAGANYIDATDDVIEIVASDTPITQITNVQIIKKDYDNNSAVSNINFTVGGVSCTTNSSGQALAQDIGFTEGTTEYNLQTWQYDKAYIADGGGNYDQYGWSPAGSPTGYGINGNSYDNIDGTTQRASFLSDFNTRADGHTDAGYGTSYTDPYTLSSRTGIKLAKGYKKIDIVESGGNTNYWLSQRYMSIFFFTDDQGCVYTAIGGDLHGKGFVEAVEIDERYSSDRIEDTIIITIKNSPIYTFDITKYAQNEDAEGYNLAGCDTSAGALSEGQIYEAVRLLAKEDKRATLHSTLRNKSVGDAFKVSMDDLRAYYDMTAQVKDYSNPTVDMTGDMTENWISNDGAHGTTTLQTWHENFKREEEFLLYQIKEIKPPEGYRPRNFYVLLDTKGSSSTVDVKQYIGYAEDGKIHFNRVDKDNTVEEDVSGRKISINLGNPKIRYDLDIHKVDIYNYKDSDKNKYNIPNTEFKIGNIHYNSTTLENPTATETTDENGYIHLKNLKALEIEGATQKIIKVYEESVKEDYRLPAAYRSDIEIQIKFKYEPTGVVYDHYKDIPWLDATNDPLWYKGNDDNYKIVTIIAEIKTTNTDPYYKYSLMPEHFDVVGNKMVEMKVENTPIISFNLNKEGANAYALLETHFTIKEYTGDPSGITDYDTIPDSDFENLKVFAAGENLNFTTTTSDFVVGSSRGTNIRFLADKPFLLIKIVETSTNGDIVWSTGEVRDEKHYSKLYAPVYITVKDGHIVKMTKSNIRDRVRLSNELEPPMNTAGYSSFTNKTQEFDLWDGDGALFDSSTLGWNTAITWSGVGSAKRHEVALDVHNLTEIWIDLTKIFTGFLSGGTISGEAKFTITSNNLTDRVTEQTITPAEVATQVRGKYFKYEIPDIFPTNANGVDTNQTLTTTFTVKEMTTIYNNISPNPQFWAEIPDFTFTVTFQKNNPGYIWITNIGTPQAVDSKFQKTIEDLVALKYKQAGYEDYHGNYIDITPKAHQTIAGELDRNATIDFKMRDPQVKSFKFQICKYDVDMHAGAGHPNVDRLSGVPFKIKVKTVKGEYTWNRLATSPTGYLIANINITSPTFRRNIGGNQTGNCLIDSTEDVVFYFTELEEEVNRYYKFKKNTATPTGYPMDIIIHFTIDDDGYYRIDEHFKAGGTWAPVNAVKNFRKLDNTGNVTSNPINPENDQDHNLNAPKSIIEIYQTNNTTETVGADVAGVVYPYICSDTNSKNRITLDLSNKRRWVRLQGTVWEDIVSSGKVSEVNGTYDGVTTESTYIDANNNTTTEKTLAGIKVRLHKRNEPLATGDAVYNSGYRIFNRYAWRILEYNDNAKLEFKTASGENITFRNTKTGTDKVLKWPGDAGETNATDIVSTQDTLKNIIGCGDPADEDYQSRLVYTGVDYQEEIAYLETETDANGFYSFPAPMFNGEYYVEFIYNGYKYEHTLYSEWNGGVAGGAIDKIRSNATETESDRDNLNNQFAIIAPGVVKNEINNTAENQTSFGGINIGISAFTGGFGRDDTVRFSATKSFTPTLDPREATVYSDSGRENHLVPNNINGAPDPANANPCKVPTDLYGTVPQRDEDRKGRNVYVKYYRNDKYIASVAYDYIYNDINFGITPREAVRLSLKKAVSAITLNSGESKNDGAEETYINDNDSTGNSLGSSRYQVLENDYSDIKVTEYDPNFAPSNDPSPLTKEGPDFRNADIDSQNNYYKRLKNAVGDYDIGIRVEDEYAYKENGDGKNYTVRAKVKYAISLTNNSPQIGIQINEIVDYFDTAFKADNSYIKVEGDAGELLYNATAVSECFRVTNPERTFEVWNSENTSIVDNRNFREMHIMLGSKIQLDPFETKTIYVTLDMPLNSENVIINDNAVNNTNANILKTANISDLGKEELENKVKVNIAEVYSYSTYYVTEGLNYNNTAPTYNEHTAKAPGAVITEHAGLVDINSNPGNVNSIQKTGFYNVYPYIPRIHEYDDGIAFVRPYELRRRTLSGNVWVDRKKAVHEDAVVGDGIRETEANELINTKVQLREYVRDSNKNIVEDRVARLYVDSRVYPEGKINGNYEIKYSDVKLSVNEYDSSHISDYDPINSDDEWIDAPTIIIDSSGKEQDFTFIGITTGDYYLLFTYPDGQTYRTTTYNGCRNNGFDFNNPNRNDNVTCDLTDYKYDSYNGTGNKINGTGNHFYSDARDFWDNDYLDPAPYSGSPEVNYRIKINNILGTGEYERNGDIGDDYEKYVNNNPKLAMNAITGIIHMDFEKDGAVLGSSSTKNNIWLKNRVIVGGNRIIDFRPDEGTKVIEFAYGRQFDIKNVDMGLVERPRSQLKITKDVNNVKIVAANGSILFDATQRATNVLWTAADPSNPEKDQAGSYYTNVIQSFNPNNPNAYSSGNRYLFTNPDYAGTVEDSNRDSVNYRYSNSVRNRDTVLITMDSEVMQGAKLSIKYDIKVTNVGEVDYSDKKFYYTGQEDDKEANIVKTSPEQIIDYVGYQWTTDDHATRNNLNYEKDLNNAHPWEPKTVNYLHTEKLISGAVAAEAEKYTTIVMHNSTGDKDLIPFVSTVNKPKDYNTKIILTKVLSTGTDDLTYNNLIEIVRIKNDVGRRSYLSTVGNQNPIEHAQEIDADDSGVVILSTPYGEKRLDYIAERIESKGNFAKASYTMDIYLGIAIFILSSIEAVIIIQKRKNSFIQNE